MTNEPTRTAVSHRCQERTIRCQSGRVHLHVNGRALCGVRSPWYPRDPLPTEQRCSRCAARAEREGIVAVTLKLLAGLVT